MGDSIGSLSLGWKEGQFFTGIINPYSVMDGMIGYELIDPDLYSAGHTVYRGFTLFVDYLYSTIMYYEYAGEDYGMSKRLKKLIIMFLVVSLVMGNYSINSFAVEICDTDNDIVLINNIDDILNDDEMNNQELEYVEDNEEITGYVSEETVEQTLDTEEALKTEENEDEASGDMSEISLSSTDFKYGDFACCEYDNDKGIDGVEIYNYLGNSADVKVPDMIDGKPVVSLHSYTFSGHDFIISLDIPDTVINYSGAVYNCNNIKIISAPMLNGGLGRLLSGELPSLEQINVKGTSIGEDAFNWTNLGVPCAPNINTIILPDGLKTIGRDAFRNCKNLKSIDIPDSVTEIGIAAFYDCEKLETVKMSSKLEVFSEHMFAGCSNLKEIDFPESLKEIKKYAFSGCKSLDSVNIPETVTVIEDHAFNGTSLKNVTVPSSVEKLGKGIFEGCTSLEKMVIPMVDKDVMPSLMVYFNDNYMDMSEVEICEVKIIKGKSDIIPNKFFQSAGIKSVFIEEGITEIQDRAFSGCKNLSNVVMDNSVLTIGEGAFSGCENLESVILSSEITEIPNDMFYSCKNLCKVWCCTNDNVSSLEEENVIALPNVTSIGDEAFSSCEKIVKLYIPDSTETIGKNAFSGCCELKYIKGAHHISNIGDMAFWRYDNETILETVLDDKVSSEMLAYDWEGSYRTIIQCGTKFKWGKDNFSFKNYTHGFWDNDFWLVATLTSRLKAVSGLDVASISYYVNQTIGITKCGHCYGLSHITDEIVRGHNISEFGINIDSMDSLYQLEQKNVDLLADWFVMKAAIQTKICYPDTDPKFFNYIEDHLEDGTGVVFTYYYADENGNSGGHAVYVYGIERRNIGDQPWNYGGKDYYQRLLVYDVNSDEQTQYSSPDKYVESECEKYDIYYNDDSVVVPYVLQAGCNITTYFFEDIEDFQDDKYLLNFPNKQINTTSPGNIVVYTTKDGLRETLECLWETAIGSADNNLVQYANLPDDINEYYIESKEKDEIQVALLIDDVYVNVDSQSVDSFVVSKDFTQLTGNIKNTKVSVVSDKKTLEGYELIDLNIDNVSDAKIELVEDGLIVSSVDGVDGITIQAKSIYEEEKKCDIKIDADTDVDAVLICENDKDGSIEVLEDSDSDGVFDKIIYSGNKEEEEYHEGFWFKGLNTEGYQYTGRGISPKIDVYYGDEKLVVGKDYSLSYKNNTQAYTFDEADKNFNSKLAPTIIIKGKGNFDNSETLYFKILPSDISSASFSADEIVLKSTGREQKPKPTLTWNKKVVPVTGYTYTYYKADETDKPVGNALSVVKDVGNYVLVITGKGNFAGTRNVKLTITGEQKLVNKLTVVKIPNQHYTGKAIEPAVTIKDGKNELTKGTDYTVEYVNNVNVGTAYIVIKGTGNYCGSKRVKFAITGLSITKANVEGIQSSVTYTGNDIECNNLKLYIKATAKTPQINLTEGEDYEVSYKNNQKVGTATVIITGINGYTGVLKKTFKITTFKIADDKSGRIKVQLTSKNVEYSKGGSKPEVTVTFTNGDGSEKILEEKTDYTLTYTNNIAVNDGSNPNKIPTVKINLKGNYNGVIAKNYVIVPKNISDVKVEALDKTYTGKPNTFKTKVILVDNDGKKLTANKDYDSNVTYSYVDGSPVLKTDRIEAGTVINITVNAKANSNYTGSVTCTYRITRAAITSAKVSIPAQIYTGKEIEPEAKIMKVKVGTVTLDAGKDFEVVTGSYTNNIKKGTASVTIRGIGNYGGIKKVNFKIKAKSFMWWWRK